jgi:thiosulfate reductase cytochrome b subunit
VGAGPSAAPADEPRDESLAPLADEAEPPRPRSVYRHTVPTRIAHWIAVLCLPILTMSGFQIFNAHPTLYWGDRSDPGHALVELEAGFPHWATLPGEPWLAMGRRWHFFFAWILVICGLGFASYSLVSRHLARDLLPWPRDLRGLGASIRDHLRFRHPSGEAATRYNVLQKIAYTGVVFGLAPLIVVTGLALSPRFDAAFPWVVRVLGGRQSARTLHFVATFAFIGFTLAHLFMVAATGIVNNARSMVTGWYRVTDPERVEDHGHVD